MTNDMLASLNQMTRDMLGEERPPCVRGTTLQSSVVLSTLGDLMYLAYHSRFAHARVNAYYSFRSLFCMYFVLQDTISHPS